MNEENTVTNTKAPKKEKKKQPLVCEIFDYLEIFVFAATAVLLLFTFSIRLCTVDGDSMFDTLKNGQMLLVSDIFYTPDNNDIIVFHQSDNSAKALNKPVVCVCGSAEPTEAIYEAGIDAVFSIAKGPMKLEDALKNGPELLENLCYNIAGFFVASVKK